jgi:hypothetical protein
MEAPARREPPLPSPEQLVQSMARRLQRRGVSLQPEAVRTVAADPDRLAALMARDFKGERTAFEHIQGVADAKVLADGAPSAPLAAGLFELLGNPGRAPSYGRCYARTSHAIFTKHHPAEFARIVGQLATSGRVTLAGGEIIRWNPKKLPVENAQHIDVLWGAVNHLTANRDMGRVLNTESEFASNGQMANIFTRLTGKRHVNVSGDAALPYLNDIVAEHGPMLAEYGNHGGSVAKVKVQYLPESLEAGNPVPSQRNGLGYVVIPESEAKSRKLEVIRYGRDNTGYARRSG